MISEKKIDQILKVSWFSLFLTCLVICLITLVFSILLNINENLTTLVGAQPGEIINQDGTGAALPPPASIYGGQGTEPGGNNFTGYRGSRFKVISDNLADPVEFYVKNPGVLCNYEIITDTLNPANLGRGGGVLSIVHTPINNILQYQPVRFANELNAIYPAVARWSEISGRVDVWLYVNEFGNLSRFCYSGGVLHTQPGADSLLYLIELEDPPGWFFAKAVIEEIKKAHFVPLIIGGKPEPVFVKITWNFSSENFKVTGSINH